MNSINPCGSGHIYEISGLDHFMPLSVFIRMPEFSIIVTLLIGGQPHARSELSKTSQDKMTISTTVIFNICKKLTGATAGFVGVPSADGARNEVVFMDSGGFSCKVDPNLLMPMRGLWKEVYDTERLIYLNDFPGSAYAKFLPEGHVNIENVLMAPLTEGGKKVGLLGLANKPGGFTDADVQIVSGLADIATIADVELRQGSRGEDKEGLTPQLETSPESFALKVALNLAKSPSRKEYLDTVLEMVRSWSGCHCVGIRMLDDLGNMPFESYVGFSREFWEWENWLSAKNDQCICTRIMTEKTESQDTPITTSSGSFRCDNMRGFLGGLARDKRKRFRGKCPQYGYLSLAFVPIRYRGRVIGGIHIADEEEGKVPPKLVEFLESITPLIGESVHKFNLEDESHVRLHQQMQLADFGKRALTGADLSVLMDEASAMVAQTLKVDYVGLLELLPGGKELHFRAGVGWGEELAGKVISAGADSLEGHTILSGEPMIVTDLHREAQFSGSEFLLAHKVVSGMSVVIPGKEQPFGVLGVYTAIWRKFTEYDIQFLRRIANILAEAIGRKQAEDALICQANFDELTGLANRNLLQDRLNQALAFSHRHDCGLAVLFIDLDNFKNINDSLGHDAGDALLTQVASRLTGSVREGDTVARQGGDEFAMILPEIRAEDDVSAITQKFVKAMSAPFDVGGHDLHITCSIGIASYPKDGEDRQTLLKNADAAMYRAKEMGRNNAQYYAAEMNVKAMERLMLENSLRHALERNECLLHYQPQVDLRTGEIVGMEALVRWRHPELGLVSPARFIPVAEESGLIVPLGEWVLRTACAQNKAWQRAGLKPISVAVNLSARQFRQPNLVEMVAGILRETELDPAHLDLEVTESLVMQNVEATIATLGRLKAMGVKLSIDDFGTGYSSLNYLKRFPIHTLKIDQSFVRDITTDPSDAAIAKTIIAMAHELGLTVIAEGVETEEQKSFLRLSRCDEMQGYLFSRPVPEAEFEILLREGRCLQDDEAAADLSQRTLLLLDDEENILTSLTRLLRCDGYKILKATHAAAALDLLAQNPVGVIISDQRMPEMSGVEFLRRVKRIYPDTVRMVLSGYTDLKSVTNAINEGAVYKFLTKPWEDDLLRANIQEAFQHYELVRNNQCLSEEMISINEELNQAKRELEKRVEQKTSELQHNIGILQISQEMLEYLPVGVIGMGEDGLIAVANRKANELFDADRQPLVGSFATERLPAAMTECLGKNGERHAYQFENGRNVIFWCHSMSAVSVSAGRVLVIVPNEQDGD